MKEVQSRKEELWNATTHGLGILLSIIGLFVLLFFDEAKSKFSTFSILVYSFSLILLYTASTVYHAVRDEQKKKLLRKFDHISIFFLIAGTYTPVTLITLEKTSGWIIFWTVWSIAALGTLLKIFFTGKYEVISLLLYLVMGWLIVFDITGLVSQVSVNGVNLLMAGGLFYTVGIIFYAIRKIPYNHVIWHFFVLGGSVTHFMFILLDVI